MLPPRLDPTSAELAEVLSIYDATGEKLEETAKLVGHAPVVVRRWLTDAGRTIHRRGKPTEGHPTPVWFPEALRRYRAGESVNTLSVSRQRFYQVMRQEGLEVEHRKRTARRENRTCPNCNESFRVLSTSKKRHCSKSCGTQHALHERVTGHDRRNADMLARRQRGESAEQIAQVHGLGVERARHILRDVMARSERFLARPRLDARMSRLAEEIASLRARHVTQRRVAELLGISTATVNRYERARRARLAG